jgi:hypothetical protein
MCMNRGTEWLGSCGGNGAQVPKLASLVQGVFDFVDDTFSHWNPRSEASRINALPADQVRRHCMNTPWWMLKEKIGGASKRHASIMGHNSWRTT